MGRVKPRNEIAEDGDLRESARRRPSVCLYILTIYRITGLSNRHLKQYPALRLRQRIFRRG